jgi:GNAT superfamily N-acetyltransferase
MTGELTLRPATADDEKFQCALYASTREEELKLTDWTEAQKDEFVRMQFAAQWSHYRTHYADAAWDIILNGDSRAGRLIVSRGAQEIRIVDISLLPEHRGLSIGTRLISRLLDEARDTNRRVGIHVEKFNPALRLYERLGFVTVEDLGVYLLMNWQSPDALK